jgi:hypothetical protein
MRTRHLLSTCLLTALAIAGLALPSQAEAWNRGYYYGYGYPRSHFSFQYPLRGYKYHGYYRPYCYYPPYRHRHFYPRGYPYSYGFYRWNYLD